MSVCDSRSVRLSGQVESDPKDGCEAAVPPRSGESCLNVVAGAWGSSRPSWEDPPEQCRVTPGSRRVDQQQTSVQYVHEAYLFSPRTCRSWACPQCSRSRASRLVERLRPVLASWAAAGDLVAMLTITLDPKLFPSKEAAFEYITKRRILPKLVGKLQVAGCCATGEYFSALHTHEGKRGGDGTHWPHWHLLIRINGGVVRGPRVGWERRLRETAWRE